MNKKGHFFKDKAWTRVLLIQLVQLALLALFFFLLLHQELEVWKQIAPLPRPALETRFRLSLELMQLAILPDRFWHMFWPLSCISLALLIFDRWKWYALAVMGLLSSLLLIADRMHDDFFSTLVSLAGLRAGGQLWTVRSSVFSSLDLADFIYTLFFAMLMGYGFFLNKRKMIKPAIKMKNFIADKSLSVIIGILALYSGYLAFYFPLNRFKMDHMGNLVSEDASNRAFTPPYATSNKNFATTFGIFNQHIKDVVITIHDMFTQKDLDPKEMKRVVSLLKEKKKLNDMESPLYGVARGRNVILIALEAFQHFVIDLEVDGRMITPNLNRIRGQGLTWDYIIDNINAGGSSDAEFSVMTGLMPDPRRSASAEHVTNNRLLALPLELKEQGYGTLSLHGNEPSFWYRDINHPRFGFEKMIFRDAFSTHRLGIGVPDKAFFEQSLDFLLAEEEPFFAYLITLSSHHPYMHIPEPFNRIRLEGLSPFALGTKYLQSVAYTDHALGIFLERLEATSLWENSLIIIYGDHIAPMADKDREELARHLEVHPGSVRQLRVPLVILIPGEDERVLGYRGSFASITGGLQDLFPTIMHLLGREAPLGLTGTHLFVPNPKRHPTNLPRHQGSYVYDGVIYNSLDGRIVRDGKGLIFSEPAEGGEPSLEERRKHYEQASVFAFLHFFLFDHDAQHLARKLEGLE